MRFSQRVRVLAIGALASGFLIVGACKSSGTKPPQTPKPAPAPAAQPSQPPAAPPAAAPTTPPANPPAATPPAGANAANAPGGRGGGRANIPPPTPPATMPTPVTPIVGENKPTPDPRVGLKAGWWDAGQAAWNMKLVSSTPPSEISLGKTAAGDPIKWGSADTRIPTHSDLAFSGKYAIQGNYNGFEIFDISNPAKPVLANYYLCPASQNDVSVYKNLIFMSSEAPTSRNDCGFGGIQAAQGEASKDRVRGIRIFDISDVKNPKFIRSVETCRGSHTHTVVTQPGDNDNVYVYISGTSGVRPQEELPGCLESSGPDDPTGARFRLEVIKIPLAHPENSAIVSSPRIFNALPVPPSNPERQAVDAAGRQGGAGRGGAAAGAAGAAGAPPPTGGVAGGMPPAGAPPAGGAGAAAGAAGAPGGGRGGRGNATPTGPNQCHDITVYPDVGLAGGACAGLGLLLDIREAANPIRMDFAADANMSFWHSATFNNSGNKVLFSDEWGGGGAPRCRATDKLEWGGDAIFTIENNKLKMHSYYKMPAAQTEQENCVAHNGSLIPIPGRDVMVQAFYQGGLTVFDWTDPDHPKEIAFFDRGPVAADRMVSGGSWSAYWYNGVIVSSEIARGLDVYELIANPNITQNELDAAKTVTFDYLNVQGQQKFVWPPSFALVKAYLDQLERSKGLDAAKIAAARSQVTTAERASGGQRKGALQALATQLASDASGAADAAKVRALSAAVTDLANATK